MSDIVERLRELEAVESELACECDCPPEATANYRYAMTCADAADTITALRAENERLRDEATRIALEAQKVCLQNIQMKFALGYPMDANLEKYVLPENPFKCGTCAASRADALEEAARVVTEHYEALCAEHRLLLVNRAAAIRALKEGK